MQQKAPLYGWGFLLAWVFCTFYLEIAGPSPSRSGLKIEQTELGVFNMALPLIITILCLFVAIALERRFGSPLEHPALFPISTVACMVGSPLMYITDVSGLPSHVLYVAGACASGVGSAILWLIWGEVFSRLSQDTTERLALNSTMLTIVLVVIVVVVAGWWKAAVTCVYVLISGVFAWQSARLLSSGVPSDVVALATGRDSLIAQSAPSIDNPHMRKSIVRGGFGIFAACAFVCLLSLFYDDAIIENWQMVLCLGVSLAMIAVVGFASLRWPRRTSIGFLYRWTCPLLVASFGMALLLSPELRMLETLSVSLITRLGFCFITQIYFARIAALEVLTPMQSFGGGWICVHAGDLAGYLLLLIIGPGVPADGLVVGSIIALVTVTMYVVNDPLALGGFWGNTPALESTPALVSGDTALSLAPDLESDGESGAAYSPSIDYSGEGEVPEEARLAGDDATRGQGRISAVAEEHGLTPRETEIFSLLAQGRSAPYIRDALVISKGTVTTHLKNIYRKLDVHSRQELIDLVYQGN